MKFTHLFFIGLLTKVYTETVTVLSTRSYRLATTELTPTDGTVYLTLTRQQSLSTSLNASTITTPPLNLSASVQTTAVTDCHFHIVLMVTEMKVQSCQFQPIQTTFLQAMMDAIPTMVILSVWMEIKKFSL